MKKIRDEVEVWADGYGFVEFRRTGTGLVPYHHEPCASKQAPSVATPLSPNGTSKARRKRYTFLA
jgi:hypothetical protein